MRVGVEMEASPETETEITVPAKRKMSRRAKIILLTLLAISLIVLALVLYEVVMIYIYSQPSGPGAIVPVISVTKSSNATTWTWAITAIGGVGSILKSNVYVQLKNASGFIIGNEPLTVASGTHGLNYYSISTGDHIAVGDVFTLSRDYLQGCSITLVTAAASGHYCVLTV